MQYDFVKPPKPYKHQLVTFKDLVVHPRWLVANDPGTGKTRSLVCAAEALLKFGRSKRALYICPDAVRESIGREIAQWTDLSCTVLRGSSEDRAEQLQSTDTYFYVVNYDSCLYIKNQLAAKGFDLLVCDESTRLKSIKSQRHKCVKTISKSCSVVWFATGSPMPKNPEDLHGQFTIIDPTIFGSSDDFKREYIEYAPSVGRIPVIIGYKNQEKLKEIIQKHSTRFRKDDCLDLPERVHVHLDVPLSTAQRKIYHQFKTDLMAELPSGTVMPIKSAMAKFMRFHQVTSGFVGSEDSGVLEWFDAPKIERLLDLLEDINLDENKVIVWCSYTPTIHRLAKLLEARNPAMFYGQVADKDAEIQKFLHDSTCRVMIGNSKVGIGCTLNVARYAVYLELPYFNTEALQQSRDRNHRIGQDQKVTYYYIMSPGTIDTTIWKSMNDTISLGAYLTDRDVTKLLEGEL